MNEEEKDLLEAKEKVATEKQKCFELLDFTSKMTDSERVMSGYCQRSQGEKKAMSKADACFLILQDSQMRIKTIWAEFTKKYPD